MQGYYTGVGSDIEVSQGFWKWVRLDPGSLPEPHSADAPCGSRPTCTPS